MRGRLNYFLAIAAFGLAAARAESQSAWAQTPQATAGRGGEWKLESIAFKDGRELFGLIH